MPRKKTSTSKSEEKEKTSGVVEAALDVKPILQSLGIKFSITLGKDDEKVTLANTSANVVIVKHVDASVYSIPKSVLKAYKFDDKTKEQLINLDFSKYEMYKQK